MSSLVLVPKTIVLVSMPHNLAKNGATRVVMEVELVSWHCCKWSSLSLSLSHALSVCRSFFACNKISFDTRDTYGHSRSLSLCPNSISNSIRDVQEWKIKVNLEKRPSFFCACYSLSRITNEVVDSIEHVYVQWRMNEWTNGRTIEERRRFVLNVKE